MKVEFINPFANAAYSVLEKEVPAQWHRGQLALKPSPIQGGDVNVMLGVTGDVEGQVILSMSQGTAISIISSMMGEQVSEIDELGKSALGELGNVITGNAAIALSNNGYPAILTPPSLFTGRELIVTTVMPVLVIPLMSEKGEVTLFVALRSRK